MADARINEDQSVETNTQNPQTESESGTESDKRSGGQKSTSKSNR